MKLLFEISQINNLIKQLISALLLLLISATIIPFNILHHHNEKETLCDLANEKVENNPCHISIYHANEFQKPHCDHKTHINKQIIECQSCKYFSSKRHPYIKCEYDCLKLNQNTKIASAYLNTPFKNTIFDVIFNKGPPV